MNRLLPAVALLATAVPFQANASGDYEYPYSGIGGGMASLADACDNQGSDCDDGTTAFRVYSGARLLSNFGVEVGYTQSQDFELNDTTDTELSLHGLDVTGLVHLPLGNRMDVFAKAGGFFWDSELDIATATVDNTGISLRTGVGAQVGITEHLYIRADYDYVPNVDYSDGALDEDDLSLITGSIQYHF
ncbi:porin family protein [uncultured Halovibrio sp.]|uniref:porin family protein n=1 Tax=uncultured Halovibrio sp. TaxID=985049 RepID=UPI0025F141DD|nr:porin family protein [uncultured Halovibrio sp.]